jgi:hypothetical protein
MLPRWSSVTPFGKTIASVPGRRTNDPSRAILYTPEVAGSKVETAA